MPVWTNVLSNPWNSVYKSVIRSKSGRLFHMKGPATEKARSPSLVGVAAHPRRLIVEIESMMMKCAKSQRCGTVLVQYMVHQNNDFEMNVTSPNRAIKLHFHCIYDCNYCCLANLHPVTLSSGLGLGKRYCLHHCLHPSLQHHWWGDRTCADSMRTTGQHWQSPVATAPAKRRSSKRNKWSTSRTFHFLPREHMRGRSWES